MPLSFSADKSVWEPALRFFQYSSATLGIVYHVAMIILSADIADWHAGEQYRWSERRREI